MFFFPDFFHQRLFRGGLFDWGVRHLRLCRRFIVIVLIEGIGADSLVLVLHLECVARNFLGVCVRRRRDLLVHFIVHFLNTFNVFVFLLPFFCLFLFLQINQAFLQVQGRKSVSWGRFKGGPLSKLGVLGDGLDVLFLGGFLVEVQ